uniref:Uncharacterized protein n=1 Tax=Takifugu rubripes TaxID=31033 RepID=A0A674N658_TAKRU
MSLATRINFHFLNGEGETHGVVTSEYNGPVWRLRGVFKVEKEPWKAYVEQLEQFLEANDVAEGKKVATLLSVMGATMYGLLRNLVQPNKLKDKTFDEIVTKGSASTGATKKLTSQLKQCAANCEFGTNLDASLRDRFVSGMRIEACTRRLLSENDLTFAKACEIALNMETADRDALYVGLIFMVEITICQELLRLAEVCALRVLSSCCCCCCYCLYLSFFSFIFLIILLYCSFCE